MRRIIHETPVLLKKYLQTPSDKSDAYTVGSNLALKRAVISRFMFNMAFENSVEAGYVTEKPFDALLAGYSH